MPNLIKEHHVEKHSEAESRSMTQDTTLRGHQTQACSTQVFLCLPLLPLKCVYNDDYSRLAVVCQGAPLFFLLFLKQPHDVVKTGIINPIYK